VKIKDYYYTFERNNIVFRPEVDNETEPTDKLMLTAFRIVNTYRINLKLWHTLLDCVFERLAVDNSEFENKMMKEIESLKAEIGNLKAEIISLKVRNIN